MSEDKNKQSKIAEGLRVLISSPVNTLLAITLLYFATKVYLFNGTMTDKLFMLGVMGIWIFWFIIKHIFAMIILLILAGGATYWHYSHLQELKTECEQNGGSWNAETKRCEEKHSLWQEFQNKIKDLREKAELLGKFSK